MPILTIDSARLNGTPSAGTVRIKASRSPLMDSGSNTVYSGTQTFPLDAQGKLSVSLPATDSPSLGAPFTYVVEANLASGQWVYRGVKLPASVATIDITDAQSASQKVYPTRQEWDAITAGMNTAIEGKVDGPGLGLRRDTSVGTRVLLDHPGGTTMLKGNTGWRDISSLLTFDTTYLNAAGSPAPTMRVKRVDGDVWWRFEARINSGPLPTNIVPLISGIPTGFRVDVLRDVLVDGSNMSGVLGMVSGSGSSITGKISSGAGSLLWGSGVCPTNDSWPSTLPGTPA